MGKSHLELKVVPENIAPELVVREKELDPDLRQFSVVKTPTASERRSPFASVLLLATGAADTFVPWGTDVKSRDLQLRSFVSQEPTVASALYSVCMRNASFEWEIVPADPQANPKNTIRAVNRMLNNSDWGRGWASLVIKTCVDLYTQDNAAIWELVRREDSPSSPVIMLNHLESYRCFRTGDPKIPIVYQDRLGVFHELKYYNVQTIEEMPMPVETLYNSQMCAVTRALRMCQIARDMLIYKHEKVSGRNPRAIDFVSGVTQDEIEQAMAFANEKANNIGLSRFPYHHIVAGVDPSNPVATQRLDLASLPDNFSYDEEMRWYIAILAMAFGVDYQEFAPLPGGQLGSSQQSEILHLKTRGKGPAAIMALFTHVLNNTGILPQNVLFTYKYHDIQAETSKANASFLRAKSRAIRLSSGELDAPAARRLAMEEGDLPDWLNNEMMARDEAANVTPTPTESPSPLTPGQVTGGSEAHPQTTKLKGGLAALADEEVQQIDEADILLEKKSLMDYWLSNPLFKGISQFYDKVISGKESQTLLQEE